MTVITHPASKPHFNALLYREIKITHGVLISLVPIMQNLASFSKELRVADELGFDLPPEEVQTLSALFETLYQTLNERSEKIAYYAQMSLLGNA